MTEVLPTIPKALDYANHMGLKIGPINPMTGAKRTLDNICLLYTSPSPRDGLLSRMPSSA